MPDQDPLPEGDITLSMMWPRMPVSTPHAIDVLLVQMEILYKTISRLEAHIDATFKELYETNHPPLISDLGSSMLTV
jgi:hypothetical protein